MARPSSFRRADRLARAEQEAHLVLGAAETVVGLTARIQPIGEHRGLYAPNPSALEAISSKVGVKPVEFGVKQRPALRVVAGAK
jgi:hypothetical protein